MNASRQSRTTRKHETKKFKPLNNCTNSFPLPNFPLSRFSYTMSHRKEQVESTLKRAITEVLLKSMSDPRIEGMVSIQRVRVADDFKVADVYVSVLPDKFEKRSLAGLRAAANHIHTKVFKSVAMRAVPRFVFQIDDALKKESAIFDSIAQAMDREGIDPSQVEHVLKPKTDEEQQAEFEAEQLKKKNDRANKSAKKWEDTEDAEDEDVEVEVEDGFSDNDLDDDVDGDEDDDENDDENKD